MAIVTAAGVVVASASLAGCSSKPAPTSTAGATPTASQVVKVLTPGNCTIFTKADAVTLLGAVNMNNTALDINTGGGTKIDACSYINLKNLQDLQGVSYAVVRYDSAATAFAAAQTVQTDMLGSAAEHNWPVQSLTTPVPGAGQVLGGYGTKTDQGVTYTIAVVGTNVGSYLVAALGASSESAGNAQALALTLFQTLAAATS